MEILDKILLTLQGATALSPSQLLGLVLLFMVGAFIYDRKSKAKEDENDMKMLAALTRMADRQEKSDEEMIKDLRGQLAELKSELNAAKEQVSMLELKITQQAGDIKLITQDRTRLETINKQLETQLQERMESSAKMVKLLEEMRKQAERREEKICELTDANAELRQEINDLKTEIASIKAGFEEQVNKLTKERDELKNKLAANTGQMTRLKNRLTELEKAKKSKQDKELAA